MFNFTNFVGFAILYFVAINLSTIIVVQFALPPKYAWIPYTVSMAIVTIICVLVAPKLSWGELAVALAAAAAPVAGPAVAAAGAGGVVIGAAAAANIALPDSPPGTPKSGGFLKSLGGKRRGGGAPKFLGIPLY